MRTDQTGITYGYEGAEMIPDITVNECISMVSTWFNNAMAEYKSSSNFEYLLLAHKYKEIVRHLKDYKELKEKSDEEIEIERQSESANRHG